MFFSIINGETLELPIVTIRLVSPAYWSDLKVGAKIRNIDGENPRNAKDFENLIRGIVGTRVIITVENPGVQSSSVVCAGE